MDIKTGVGWQVQVTDDRVEILAVIICKKKCVRVELLVHLVYAPEETDHRAGESFASQSFGLALWRQQIVINVGEVSIGENHIGLYVPTILKNDALGPI